MKKTVLFCISTMLALCMVLFVGCKDTKPTQLAKPIVTVEGNFAEWQEVANADGYEVYIDGELWQTVTENGVLFTDMEIGSYQITVVAKSDNEKYTVSQPSDAVVYTVSKNFVRIEIVSEPTKTTYYLDENSTLDLTGLQAKAVYSNSADETVELGVDDIVSTYDLTTAGEYELEFLYTGTNGVSSSVVVSISVAIRSKYDVSSYEEIINDIEETNYKIANTVLESAVKADGTVLTVTDDGESTFVSASQLSQGENFIKAGDSFVNVVVASFVETVDDFNAICDNLDGYYILRNDLDFAEQVFTPIGVAPLVETVINEETIVSVDKTALNAVAFNGTFDGKGHVIKNIDYVIEQQLYKATAQGLGLFGYLSDSATVRNIVFRNVKISGGKYCSFVAGYNEGLIENVFVEENCTLFNAYGAGAVASALNYGTAKNVVSLVTYTGYNYGDGTEDINIVRTEVEISASSGINGYVGDTTDLTSVLGDEWTYIAGYGTALTMADYKKVVSADTTWTAGESLTITVWQKNPVDLTFAVWGTGASDVTQVLVFGGYEAGVYTFTVNSSVTLTDGASYVVGVGIGGGVYIEQFTVTYTET